MSYPPQQPPVMPGHTPPPQADWTPPAPKRRGPLPWLIGALVVSLLIVGGLIVALLRGVDLTSPPSPAAPAPGDAFTQAGKECSVVAGYRIEDAGATLVITVGGAFMNDSTMDCVFDQLGVPAAVREHVGTTRALDGQQTDQWPGYTARWTYHPDDGLQMTIRKA